MNVCKQTMGRLIFKALYSPILGLVCTMFGKVDDSCWQCACPISRRYFPTSMSAANVPVKILNAHSSHAILDVQSIFFLKVLLAKKCCHTTLKQQVPYIWDPDTFSQSDRPSENVIEIEIAPEVSQLEDHSGHKNLKCYQKVS